MEVLRRRIFSNNIDNVEGDYEKEYFTLTAINSGTFKFTGTTVSGNTNSLSYSIDDGVTWTALASGSDSPTIQAGNKILWKGENLGIVKSGSYLGIGTFSASGNFEASGNVMSLYYGDDFYGIYNLPDEYIFATLFKNNSYIKNAENLSLPATTLANHCYNSMFSGCTSLTTAPELPATTLANYCYNSMFSGCTSLTTAPELPATTLAILCYSLMFYGCSSLTTAPTSLPATTLAPCCYGNMFRDCKSLTTIPASLPATTLTLLCYTGMFFNCQSLTIGPSLPATVLARQCYLNMFYNCYALTTAPDLPATTLAYHCYSNMFRGCSALTTAPDLPATTLVEGCYYTMFYDCTSLNYIKAMFTTTPSDSYTKNWVNNVAASGTFVKNSAATWNVAGNNSIPSRWTVLTSSS